MKKIRSKQREKAKKRRLGDILRDAHNEIKKKPGVATVYFLLRLSVIAIMITQIFNRNYENVFLCVLTLILFLMPVILERGLRVTFPNTLEIIILLFIYSAEILGEISSFYTVFSGWDTMLHTLNGFLCAAVGFSLVDIFNRDKHFSLSLSPFFMAVVAFCFSMTIGVLWEFFECGMDMFFLTDMQKDTAVSVISTVNLDPTGGNNPQIIRNITDVIVVADGVEIPLGVGGYLDIGLLDTMKDLFVNFIGAVVFSFFGFFYVRSHGSGAFASRFIPKVHGGDGGEPEKATAEDGADTPLNSERHFEGAQ